jgi:hypothetical protein
MIESCEFIVVGAGLSGLSAAITLQAAGREVLIIEANDRPGGRIATDNVDGYLCDRGFQLINAKYPSLVSLNVIKEIDFIRAPRAIEVAMDNERHLIGDPRLAPLSILNKVTGTIPEKISLLRVLFSRAKPNQSIGELLQSSGSCYERVLRPFLQGVFLADPDRVDARFGISVLRSFVNGSPGLPRLGVGALPEALAKRLSNVTLNTRVDRMNGLTLETTQGKFTASKIIVATDPTTAAQLLELKEGIPMAGCITWYHATPENPSGSGRLVLDGQCRGPVYNSLVVSDISSSYAPVGQNLISTTTGLGATESDVRRHLSIMWGVDTRDWKLIAKYEIPGALPLHSVGKSLSQQIAISETIFVAGDHRTVPSQQGALFAGKLAAELALS